MSDGTLIHADIFFYVTTITVVVLSLVLIAIALYVIRTLEQARRTLREVETHIGGASEDLKGILFDIRESTAYRFLFKKRRRLKHGDQQR